MKWFVISPVNGLNVFDDDGRGEKEVIDLITEEIQEYAGLDPEDFYIFRGERHDFVPPKGRPTLVKTDRGE